MRWALFGVACLIGCTLLGGCAADTRGEGRAVGESVVAGEPHSTAATGTSGSSTPPVAPGAPTGVGSPASEPSIVSPGQRVEVIQAAPPRTYAMFDLPDPFSGADFTLTAQPYGWVASPTGVAVRRLLLRVSKAEPAGGQTAAFADLTEQNALVWVDTSTVGTDEVVEGGTYRLEVTVRPSGQTGVLHATRIERAD